MAGPDYNKKLALSILIIKECMEKHPYMRRPLTDLI